MADLAYILAASHSGSTLLAMLLNAHPDVVSVGELKATNLGNVDEYRCSCGERIRSCGFWIRVSEGMARQGFAFDITDAGTDIRAGGTRYTRRLLAPLCRGPVLEGVRDAALWLSPAWRAGLPLIQERNAALVETLCEISGAKVVVDSSKIGIRLKYLLRCPGLNVKVIRLIRDGRAVTLTYMDPARFADASDPGLRGGGSGSDRRGEELPMHVAARQWRRSNEEAEALLTGLAPSRHVQIRYEELCANPAGVLGKVFGFLGLDPSKAEPDFRAVEHHVVGNGMRLDMTSEVRLDERWQAVLLPEQLQMFDTVAGALNHQYGYDAPSAVIA
jgi:hypothetical protein